MSRCAHVDRNAVFVGVFVSYFPRMLESLTYDIYLVQRVQLLHTAAVCSSRVQ